MTTASKTDTEAHILTRLGGIREDTPVGTIWQHGKWGHLYKVIGHTVAESDLSLRVIYARIGGGTPMPWERSANSVLNGHFVSQD